MRLFARVGELVLALLVLTALCILLADAVETAPGADALDLDMPALHGSRGYRHLDCSACLTVANILGARMNTSLKESSGTILVSHRMERSAGERRMGYRASELRAIEIMENNCNEKTYRENVLRLNAKTKVRGYHNVFMKDILDANRDAFLENTKFPEEEHQNFPHNAERIPVAKHYTRFEQDLFRDHVVEGLCGFLMEEREDAVSAIIRNAEYLTEVEENLCGFHHEWRPQSSGTDGEAPWSGLDVPALHVCSDVEAVAKSAKRDQQRWARFNGWSKPTPAPTEAGTDEAAANVADPTDPGADGM